MSHHFQCLKALNDGQHLVAASGPNLYVFNLIDGAVISQWGHQERLKIDAIKDKDGDSKPDDDGAPGNGPPKKKQKQSTTNAASDPPNFILLEATTDEKRIIGVTAEDKCILIFTLSSEGHLELESSRPMSRRPSALSLLPDGENLLVADKFGDLYMLPIEGFAGDLPAAQPTEPAKAMFTPAASNTTVHSGRNRATLEFQMKQVAAGKSFKTKQPLDFKHKLLLGHVSMLTDVVCATDPEQPGRTYIITTDRDEHIRVSRAPPQAHIIEKFCLAHTEFVSKICLLEDCFVTGGGDDELFLWSWPEGDLLRRLSLRPTLEAMTEDNISGLRDKKVAVTGIWSIPNKRHAVLVTCEAIPAVFYLEDVLPEEPSLATTIDLPGNPLDVAVFGNRIIISIDNRRDTGSKTGKQLHAYVLGNGLHGIEEWTEDQELNRITTDLDQVSTVPINEKIITALLYSTEQLRKRPGFGDDGGED